MQTRSRPEKRRAHSAATLWAPKSTLMNGVGDVSYLIIAQLRVNDKEVEMGPYEMSLKELKLFLMEYADQFIDIMIDRHLLTVDDVVSEHMWRLVEEWNEWEAC